MANDRLIIRCTKCDKHRVLGKWYPSMRWASASYWGPDRIHEFIALHTDCTLADDGHEFRPEPIFELIGEQVLADRKGGIDWEAEYWEKRDGSTLAGPFEIFTRAEIAATSALLKRNG